MNITELIERAARKRGSHGELAQDMDKHINRLSEWKRGAAKPDAHEIAYMASVAGLPVLETVAEIEAQLDQRYSTLWREALGKLKAAGVAASLAGVGLLALPSHEVKAATLDIARICTGSALEHGAMPICSVARAQLLHGLRQLWATLRTCLARMPSRGRSFEPGSQPWPRTCYAASAA